MLYLYFANSEVISKRISLEELMTDLPEQVREKALRYRFKLDAYNFVLGRKMLQQGLIRFGLPPSLMGDLTYNHYGKPQLPPVYFNISHSRNLVACALTQVCPVGIDLEVDHELDLAIFQSYFCQEVWENIYRAPDPVARFFFFWRRKESILKALGVGLDHLQEVKLAGDQQSTFSWKGQTLFVGEKNLPGNHPMSVCLHERLEMAFIPFK